MAGASFLRSAIILFSLTSTCVQSSLPDKFQEIKILTTRNYKDCIHACDVYKDQCNLARYREGRCTLMSARRAPNLVGFWPLNSEYLTRDISGNGNHGLVTDVYWRSGPDGTANGAYSFMGRSQSNLEIGNNGALDVRYSMTLALYVNAPSSNYRGPLFEWTYPGGNDVFGVHIYQRGNGELYVRYNKRGGIKSETLVHFLKVNTWNYIATSYDYSTGTAKIFHNGTLVANKFIGRHELETSRKVRVGSRDKSGSNHFTGKISCVQLYDGELSIQEIFGAVKDKCKPPVASASACSAKGYLVSGEKKRIPDAAMRWSSIDSCARKASLARLDSNVNGFCDSFKAATTNSYQYLQFDLGTPHVVIKIVTQGRRDGSEWVKQYRILYSMDGVRWVWYRKSDATIKIFSANTDRDSKKVVTLPQPTYARFWRIRPYSWYNRISMRADIIGCY